MRVALDTNVLLSGAAKPNESVGLIVQAFVNGQYELVTGTFQLAEFRRVSRYPRVRKILPAARAGFLMNRMLQTALIVDPLEPVDASPDPDDNVIIAVALTGNAEFLVSGDGRHMTLLKKVGTLRIVTVQQAMKILELKPRG